MPRPEMTLEPGAQLGPYEVVAPIGAGGMGEVYKARDTRLDRLVAIKVLPTRSAGDGAAELRFKREARAIAALNHTNICAIYDVGSTSSPGDASGPPLRYIVMELLEGETLHQRLLRGPFAVPALLEIAIPLSDALASAHERGVIHRDLKPANIYLTSRGVPKLLDFGLAKAVGPSEAPTQRADAPVTGAGTTVGTVGYMSPEQLRGEPADARSDLFSFGLVLYEMATGRRAFEGSTAAVVSAAVLGQVPMSPSALRPDLPAKLEETILITLEKDRDTRCQTAAELRADLKRVARALAPAGSPVAASVVSHGPPTAAGTPPTPTSSDGQLVVDLVRRHRGVTALAVIGVVAVLAWTGWVAIRPKPAAPSAASVPAPVIQPLTLTGNAWNGALSPDGKFVAYLQRVGTDAEIWVRVLATGSARRIVEATPGRAYLALAVTPDDSYIDYVATGQGPGSTLYRVPFLGDAPPRQLATGLWSAVGWSSDGRHVAFVRDGGRSLVVANADASGERVLAQRRPDDQGFHSNFVAGGCVCRPSWSPDGTRLLVLGGTRIPGPRTGRYGTTYEAVIIDAATGAELKAVTIPDTYPFDSAWIDDARVLVDGTTANKRRLSILDLPSGALTPFASELVEFRGVSQTTDRSAAVSTRVDERSSAWIGAGVGTDMVEAVRESPAQPTDVAIDNAGNIAYTARSATGTAVYVLGRGDAAPRLIADDAERPALTSDGRVLVYHSTVAPHGIYRINSDGTGRVQLVAGGDFPALTRDDRTVIFVDFRELAPGQMEQRLYRVPLSGGTPQDLSKRWASWARAQLSHDGRQLLFAARTDTLSNVGVLCEMPECTNPTELSIPRGRWTPDDRAVAYVDPKDRTRIIATPIAGGEPYVVKKFAGEQAVGAGNWSPDGKRLVVTRWRSSADIVLIKGFSVQPPASR